MTAVSQSYPEYLGGLNEQPDELKKPGQLVEALNVIPDPVIGLTRRPGFKKVADLQGFEPNSTWFELELSNQINSDYIYFGCVRRDGVIEIVNQDGVSQEVRYADDSLLPHKRYEYFSKNYEGTGNALVAFDENDKVLQVYETEGGNDHALSYFKHRQGNPLKYCVSKSHIIFTNTTKVPQLAGAQVPTNYEEKKYYSFINLKVLDTENYNYIFKRFYPDDQTDGYKYITKISIESIDDIDADYDQDLTLPLQTEGPFTFDITPKTSTGTREDAQIEVRFVGQVVQLKSEDGDGFRNEARYSYYPTIVTPGKGFRKGEVYTETLPGLNGLPDLTIKFKIEDVNSVTATRNDDINPNVTGDMSIDQILSSLKNGFESSGIDKAVVVGNGIYLENGAEFSVSTSEIAVADVINSQKLEDDQIPLARVNTVAELPTECYDGFIVQVKNSFDGSNDYYLQYQAESESKDDLDLTKADGFWEEIAKPFERDNPQNATLPHMVTVVRDSDRDNFVFVVTKMSYEVRTAGTVSDNPSMFVDESPITEVNYYKNRLFMFTKNGSVISSRAGEINNLFLNTAINTSIIDPIDIVANSNQRVGIYGSAVVNNGLVLFGESEQYSLSTSNDVLTSETANVTKISSYTFERGSRPIQLGSNIGFISSGLTRMYEMTNVYDRGPVDIVERSQQIQSQFGQGFDMPVSSREQSQVIVYKRHGGALDNSKSLYLYRYRQESSQESSQTSWVKWTLDKPIAYVSMPQNKMFVVVGRGSDCDLYLMDSSVLEGLPANPGSLGLVPNYTDGYTDDSDGVPFETRITFPTIYARSGDKSDVNANLTIHRLKLHTAAIGAYNLNIHRKGYDSYSILVEQTPSDEYRSEFPTLYGEHVETVPVYTRNKNLSVTITTEYNAPLTLQSMAWEGDYNRPFYKSV